MLAGYRDAARELDRLFRKTEDERPALEVTTPDRTLHRLWRVSSAEVIGKVRPLFAPKKLHVLDGHARYEAMLGHAERFAEQHLPMYASANYGLACLVNVEDPGSPSRRVTASMRAPGLDRAAVLEAARQRFLVEKLAGAAANAAKHAPRSPTRSRTSRRSSPFSPAIRCAGS